MSNLDSINRAQGLYVLKSGNGFSCLGFEVARKRTSAYAQWLERPDLMPPTRKGTKRAYAAYCAALAAVLERNRETGKRCNVELIPELRGLEGKRVEVTEPDGTRNRFYVGRSTGPIPIHLEIKRRNSMSGCAAYVPDGATVRVIGAR